MDDQVKIKELLHAYFDGEINETDRQYVEEMLAKDAELRKYYAGLSKLSSVLSEWKDEAFSADLNHKIQKRLKEKAMKKEFILSKSLIPIGATSALTVVITVVIVNHLFVSTMKQRSLQSQVRDASQYIATPGSEYVTYQEMPKDNIDAAQTKTASIDNARLAKSSSAVGKKEKTLAEKNLQYEPYYLASDYDISKPSQEYFGRSNDAAMVVQEESISVGEAVSSTKRARAPSGFQASTYNTSFGVAGGLVDDDRFSSGNTNSLYYPAPNEPYYRGSEQYESIMENEFLTAYNNPLSTFSIDVDTTSYSNIRRFLTSNQMPPADAVRIEEMVNYFTYDYPQPQGRDPFSITTKASICPWNPAHQLVMIGLQGKTFSERQIPPSNLVFLIDVSGSMDQPNKLPLLKNSFRMLVEQLGPNERVAIVTYAGNAGVALYSTSGSDKQRIIAAIDNLYAGGSTAGAAGIQLAYDIARQNFIKGGNNRVILATDGDFNVGVSNDDELVRLIESQRQDGIFLTILGFGTGNYKDAKMEKVANHGNGTYHYIDSLREGQKVLVEELGSTLFTIAKDVKIQVEFNPAQVKAYRLIGYENRVLAARDFNNDRKDAGELGAGHTVTALYEVIPAYSNEEYVGVDPLKYQKNSIFFNPELMTVKLRYKHPESDTSKLIQQSITIHNVLKWPQGDFQFAASVAEFGLLLKNSQHRGYANYQNIIHNATQAKGKDSSGQRQEFINLVETAQRIDGRHLRPLPIPMGYSEQGSIQFKGEE